MVVWLCRVEVKLCGCVVVSRGGEVVWCGFCGCHFAVFSFDFLQERPYRLPPLEVKAIPVAKIFPHFGNTRLDVGNPFRRVKDRNWLLARFDGCAGHSLPLSCENPCASIMCVIEWLGVYLHQGLFEYLLVLGV